MLGMAVAIFWPQEPEEQWASILSTIEMENKNCLRIWDTELLKQNQNFLLQVFVV